ncbi:MAG: LacI family DNA-binding transcriptional regulator [Christensenellales bacterium]
MSNTTMKDIAKAVNVSVATVSRVINKHPCVKPGLRTKVLDAIQQMNYYPNLVARGLKNETTHSIAFVISDISNAHFAMIARSIEETLYLSGYTLFVCNTNNNPEKELSYLRLLIERKVDGIIINTSGGNNEFLASLSQRLPIILCNRNVTTPGFIGDYVDYDNYYSSYTLTSRLISFGHRKIGIISGPQQFSSGRERLEGFSRAMEQINITVDSSYKYLFSGNFDVESGYQQAKMLCEMADPPTALLIANGQMTLGALKYFRINNVRIPDDISIACTTSIINQELFYVQPSVATMDPWTLGKKSADFLLDRIINGNNIHNREVRYSPQIIPGNSIKQI